GRRSHTGPRERDCHRHRPFRGQAPSGSLPGKACTLPVDSGLGPCQDRRSNRAGLSRFPCNAPPGLGTAARLIHGAPADRAVPVWLLGGVVMRGLIRRAAVAAGAAVVLLGPAVLTASTSGTARASVVPGRNGKIVVGQVFPNFGFTINPNGSERDTIGPSGSTTCIGWSPDGRKVLCNLWGKNHVQPGTANPDGSGFHLLNPARRLDLFCLSWSPTGQRLLCHSEGMQNPAQAGLYSIRAADGRGLVRITATPSGFFDNGYGFSPSG